MSLFDDLPLQRGPRKGDPVERDAAKRKPAKREPAKGNPAEPARPAVPQPIPVGRLTRRIAESLAAFGSVAVEGEIGGLKRAGSGHVYFSLKDEGAVLSCAIWRSRVAQAAPFPLEEGARVVCHGRLDVYAPRGSYSLIVERVERRGLGELLARLEECKRELAERGWFDRSRPLPRLPRRVGLVTSRDADALADFLRTRSLRWPLYPLRLIHSRVQGAGAAGELAQAIAHLDASGVDVICLVRGGGSLEDLWCFNERVVAEALWRTSVPVVTGVGHESDQTLADLVADHRAHTPTDAAQTVIPDRDALTGQLERLGGYLADALDRRLERAEAATERLARRLGAQGPEVRLERLEGRLGALAPRLVRAGEGPLAARAERLRLVARGLEATSPFAVLARGYSITRRAAGGAPLTSPAGLAPGEGLVTVLASGTLTSEVREVREECDGDPA